MSDIIGPANAANAVTVRPAETRSFLALDTWFQDCSGPLADDGTSVEASWLNGMLAWSRAIWRSNGNRLDGVTPVVPEVGTDDSGVLKAIQHLVQRGQVAYAADTGTANALVAALTPAPVEYKTGMRVVIKAANANTGASTLNLNGLGAKTIKRPDGTALLDSDIAAGSVNAYVYDGTNFQLQGAVAAPRLARNTTIYVNGAIGNDANDGTANVAGKALATIQGAVNLAFRYGPSEFTITVVVAAGAYAAGGKTPLRPGPSIVIDGGSSATTTVTATNDYCFLVQGPNVMKVQNIKVAGNVTTGGPAAFTAGSGATLTTANTASGWCGGAVFQATGSATVVPGTHTFTDSSYAHFWASFGGTVRLPQGVTYTLSAAQGTVVATVFCAAGGAVPIPNPSAPVWVNPGNMTGAKFLCATAGGVDSSGYGVNYFPGNNAGTVQSPGYYV